jgi:NIMA (never in mitosis gene a)-related kinase
MIGNYHILEKIGKGTFGIVYKAKRINDPLIYVIKQISLNGLTEEQINQVYKEAKILSLIKSNYVVKYYESFLENQDLNIVMEYCDNGDLCNYLNMQKTPLKEDLIWQIFIKITLGLTTIHKMKILHRDLKTLNILNHLLTIMNYL